MNNGNVTTSRGGPCAVFFDRTTNHWLEFRKPLAYFLATEISDVLPSLQNIESVVRENSLFAAGFISYEAAPAFDNSLTVKTNDGDDFPLLWFGIFAKPAIVELSSEGEFGNNIGPAQWKPTVSRSEYDDCFRRIKELIACGDTYQVNYTYRLRSTFSGDPFSFFRSIAGANPPPYACYCRSWPWEICSFSPELFFERTGSLLRSRPMKGTHVRGRSAEEDDEFARTLFQSDKNRAENIMIVDMVRNDIGRIAEFGAVQTGELYSIERYPTVL
jgi:para-aminobenzoate synthetase / 4-amino-4-deoxychorismate lyase